MMKCNKLLLTFSLVLFFILISNFLIHFNIKYYYILLLILYILCFIVALKKNYVIINLFLISLFVFQYSIIILSPVLFKSDTFISWFHNYKISDNTLYFICRILLYNLLGIYLGVILFKEKNYKVKKERLCLNKIFFTILIICFIFFLFNKYLFLKNFYQNGNYLDIFLSKTRKYVTSNIFIRILSAIFYPLLNILIAFYINKKNKKIKIILFSLYLIANFISSLSGRRIFFINSIFTTLFFLVKKIKIKHFFISLFIFFQLICFSQFINNYRTNGKLYSIKIDTLLKDFIYEQGTTGTFLALLKDKPELFERKMPYIFSSFMGKTLKSQADDSVDVRLPGRIHLAVQLSARSNYDMYKQGFGMGGNYIIEMYDLGKEYGVIILSFLFTYFSLYFFQNIYNFNFFFRSILIFILDGYFSIPRSSYFPNIFSINFLYVLIIFLGIMFLEKILVILRGK